MVMNKPKDVHIIMIEGRDAQENAMIYLKKMLWTIKITWNMSEMLVWSTRWEQLNSWEPPQILMPKCAKLDRLAYVWSM